MLGRLAALAVCVSLGACANLEPAGRNANRDPAPPRPAAAARPAPAPAVAPLPAPTVSAPTPAPSAAPVISAPAPAPAPVAAAPSPAPAAARPAATLTPAPVAAPTSGRFTPNPQDDEVVVPGQRDRQITPPGDPRSTSERMEDIRSWDQCVSRVQAAYERDPLRPQLDSPEEYCARSLGMSNRDAIPMSRQERRR